MAEIATLVKASSEYKLTVTQNLEDKIRFLCSKLPHTEYSGTLFYTTEGSFETKDLHIIAKDFYLQDVGSSGFTEFKNDVGLASFMVQNGLFDCYTGLLHSHHNMATIFTEGKLGSGTDMNTLKSEGSDNNHFVSIIVNNAGKYAAAITRKITESLEGISNIAYKSFNDEEKSEVGTSKKMCVTKVEYHMLDIITEQSTDYSYLENSELNTKLVELQKPKYIPALPWNLDYRKKEFPRETSQEPRSVGYSYHSLWGDDYEEYTYGKSEIPSQQEIDRFVYSIVCQLITSNMFASYISQVNLKSWVTNMEKNYARRFPDFTDFQTWANTLIDYLNDEIFLFSGHKDDIVISILGSILDALNKYPSNPYIDYYKTYFTYL